MFQLITILLLINLFIIIKQYKQMATITELVQGLNDLSAEVAKIGLETQVTLQKVTDLQLALENSQTVTPEVQAAFDALKLQIQAVDDLIADAPTE
jgi:preprotein translocase subunit YajC